MINKNYFVTIIILLLSISLVSAIPVRVTVTDSTIYFETDDGITNTSVPKTNFFWTIEINNTINEIQYITTNVTVEQITINNTIESIQQQIFNYTSDCPSLTCPSQVACPACSLTCPELSCPAPDLSEIPCVVNESIVNAVTGTKDEMGLFKIDLLSKLENATTEQTSIAIQKQKVLVGLITLLIVVVIFGITAYFAYKVYGDTKLEPKNKLAIIKDEIKQEQKVRVEELKAQEKVKSTEKPDFKIEF